LLRRPSAAFILTLLLFGSVASVISASPPTIKRPMEIVQAGIEGGTPETVDPAWSYDTASAELIMQVYESLIVFDGEHVERLLPALATNWTVENITGETSPEGLDWYYRYIFEVRTGSARAVSAKGTQYQKQPSFQACHIMIRPSLALLKLRLTL
jgi:ABC-type transport system substrate-binding protein